MHHKKRSQNTVVLIVTHRFELFWRHGYKTIFPNCEIIFSQFGKMANPIIYYINQCVVPDQCPFPSLTSLDISLPPLHRFYDKVRLT